MSGITHEGSGFFTPHPMRHRELFEFYFQAQPPHFLRDILDRPLGLWRTGQARADAVRQVGQLAIGIVARECRLLELLQIGRQLRRVGDRPSYVLPALWPRGR